MVVLIVDSGRVEQRVVDLGVEPVGRRRRAARRRMRVDGVNADAAGRASPRPRRGCIAARAVRAGRPRRVRAVVGALDDALVEEREERVVLAGTATWPGSAPTSRSTIGPVLEALEEHVVLLKLLGALGR